MEVVAEVDVTVEDVLPDDVGPEVDPEGAVLDELTPEEVVPDDTAPEELEAALEELEPILELELGFKTT